MPDFVGTLNAPRLTTPPASPIVGTMYYDTAQNGLFYWNGTQWVGASSTAAGHIIEDEGVQLTTRKFLNFKGTNVTVTDDAANNASVVTVAPILYDTDPVGAIKAWSGAAIPTNWMIADGRALQRASYPDLFTALGGTSSPWGLPDGSSFNIPDLRGRMIVGSGAGANLTNRVLSAVGGEESHLLVPGEGSQNGNATSGYVSNDHTHNQGGHAHNFNVNTGTESVWHQHGPDWGYWINSDGSGLQAAAVWNNPQAGHTLGVYANAISGRSATANQNQLHTHNVAGGTDNGNGGVTGGINQNHYHAMNARNADSAHNNMPPWCAVALIIKVVGVQVDSGGAIRGATGLRGATWFVYNGVGTPPAGTFTGELDGDFAIRKSDGEEFQRVNGVWTDMGFTNRSTAAITAARAYRNAAFTLQSGDQVIPLDTVSFDTASMFSNGRFYCPTAGYYQVSGAVTPGGTAQALNVKVFKNGALAGTGQGWAGQATNTGASIVSQLIQCNAGDYLELWCNGSATAQALTVGTPNYTYMSVALITAGPGPIGQRGGQTFTYTGAGTPAAGTFPNELDGDMAVRASDGEVFSRISGAWVDQGWTMRTGTLTLDKWHLIGAAGEPAFQNGCTNWGGGYAPAGFRKFPDGRVQLSGLINKNGSAVSAVLFSLPPGYRPTASLGVASFSIPSSDAFGEVRVDPSNGNVWGIAGSTSWMALDGVEFDTGTVTVMAQGTRGSNWFTYTGAGTPAAGSFTGELDGDLAVRSSDSEVFKRVSGVWTDQGYKAGGAMAQSPVAAKARRAASVAIASGWNKIPLDTVLFDTLGTIISTANGRINIPYTGYYQVSAQTAEYANTEMLINVAVNGTIDSAPAIRGSRTMQAGQNNAIVSGLMYLNVGDYLELYIYSGAATTLTGAGAGNWMTIAMIQAGQGPQGIQGIQGVQGPIGLTGPQGVQGPTGSAGQVYDSDQVGVVKAYAGSTLPTNWMLADGSSLLRSAYPDLFTAIGTTFGSVDGTHFNLPDLRARFVYGGGALGGGAVGGETAHQLVTSEMPSHTHVQALGGSLTTVSPVSGTGVIGTANTANTQATGGDQSHNNMPPYIVLAYIIKVIGITIDPGNTVRGAAGPQGPAGLVGRTALSAQQIGDVGMSGQIRAGRQLAPADFTNLGLSAPIGLWNLSDLTDASGNARNLSNKGAVTFASGINGAAATAAQFTGSTAQALYISDTGAADPFRIRTGSWGCWFRTAKRGTGGVLIGKSRWTATAAISWQLEVTVATGGGGPIRTAASIDGSTAAYADGVTDTADDRWHFAVGTFDGTAIRTYVDGVLEASALLAGAIYSAGNPFNIGNRESDGATAGTVPHYGRVDEAFVTTDVLSDDQVRALYCAAIPHGASTTPSAAILGVRRRRKGGLFVAGDFPTVPMRLYNFTAGALTDAGSQGQVLTMNGTPVVVAGADGSQGGGYSFNATAGQNLSASDAALPAGTTSRSYGCWFKTTATGNIGMMGWGTVGTADARLVLAGSTAGSVRSGSASDTMDSAAYVIDGQWHLVVVVEDNGAIDGVKRKMYVDGRLTASSLTLNSITLYGATGVRIGDQPGAAGSPFNGQIDGAFICGYALTSEQIQSLYAKGSMSLAPSPKEPGPHIESMDATNVYAIFDTLPTQHAVDLAVGG